MKITRLSKNSWFKITTNKLVIYFDPGYMGYYENQNISEDELKQKADYIFISHEHKDHFQI